ncbi:hypothetical protein D3C80_877710 [compost metagenome]
MNYCPISYILSVSQKICTYDKNQIMHAVTEETGELATEVAIDLGYKKRPASPDGVVGEAVDLIITAVDMINAQQPGITVDEIFYIVANKCNKWASKVHVRPEGCCCAPPGYSGIWAAAMCPVHFGLRRLQQ